MVRKFHRKSWHKDNRSHVTYPGKYCYNPAPDISEQEMFAPVFALYTFSTNITYYSQTAINIETYLLDNEDTREQFLNILNSRILTYLCGHFIIAGIVKPSVSKEPLPYASNLKGRKSSASPVSCDKGMIH